MNAKRKGEGKEKEVRKILEEQAYVVDTPGRRINYIPDGRGGRRPVVSDNDLFGAFDLIAIRSDRPTLFVQVCSADQADILRRKRKIGSLPIPVNDMAMIFSWHGGRKALDRRFKKKKAYKPFQYYNIYVYINTDNPDPRYRKPDEVDIDAGWYWLGPLKMFHKVQIHNRCWICNRDLEEDGCRFHPGVGNIRLEF